MNVTPRNSYATCVKMLSALRDAQDNGLSVRAFLLSGSQHHFEQVEHVDMATGAVTLRTNGKVFSFDVDNLAAVETERHAVARD